MATLFDKTRMLRGLLTRGSARRGPFYVDVDLSSRCNLQCLGCRYHSPLITGSSSESRSEADIPLDLFERLCGQLKTMETHSLILQGSGEPMLHADVFEMISVAKAVGFHVTLITNGTLLDQHTIEALFDARLDTLKVSLWASSVKQYEQNYPGANPSLFARVVDGLRDVANLKTARNHSTPVVCLHHPINHHNSETIDDFVGLALAARCNKVSFAPFVAARGELESCALSVEEVRLVQGSLERAREKLRAFPMKHNIDEALTRYSLGSDVWQTLPCYIAWYHARIRVDGTVQPCGRCNRDLVFGNIHDSTFDEIWNGPAIRRFRREGMNNAEPVDMLGQCDCDFCCYVSDNLRVHRVFRWFAPFVVLKSNR